MHRCLRPLASRSSPWSHKPPSIIAAASRLSYNRVFSARGYASVSAAELTFGQPLHETHPHLLKAGELTPGITAAEYASRRTKLAASLPAGGIALLPAADVKHRSTDVWYDFHQNANFLYLTGFNEPDALAVIGKSADGQDHHFHLFVRGKDPEEEQWTGYRSGTQAALDVFNADETGDIKDITSHLKPLISSSSRIFTDFPSSDRSRSFYSRFISAPSPRTTNLTTLLQSANVSSLADLVHPLRAIKSPSEIALMRLAGQRSGRALTAAMSRPWVSERDLATFIEHEFQQRGCDDSAYVPVVAGGANASIIHYTANNALLNPTDLVLVDAGGEFGAYISDITRTWAAGGNGKFTPAQRDLYSTVLATQRECINLCRANAAISLDALHSRAHSLLRDSLSQLFSRGLSNKDMDTLFPHHVGHYIGLEVHDTPGLSRKQPLREGHCVTVEPGVYVPDTEEWPAAFRGLGVRIEDSVCVREDGPVVLSVEAVKEVEDIEALRS